MNDIRLFSIHEPKERVLVPPHRILIIEDEPVLAENLRQYLSRHADDVRAVGDGESAIRMLDSFTPDALVLDYGLPGMDGLQTYVEIVRRHARRIASVMITGIFTEELAEKARQTGIGHLLCKPFSFSELLQLIEATTVASVGTPDSMALPEEGGVS